MATVSRRIIFSAPLSRITLPSVISPTRVGVVAPIVFGGGGGSLPTPTIEPAGFVTRTLLQFTAPPSIEDPIPNGWATNGNGRLVAPFNNVNAVDGITGRLSYINQPEGKAPITTWYGPASGGTSVNSNEIYFMYSYLLEGDLPIHYSGFIKTWFVCNVGAGGAGNPGIFGTYGVGLSTDVYGTAWHLEGGIPLLGGNNNTGNRVVNTPKTQVRDQFYTIEVYINQGSIGGEDGVIKVAVNGQLRINVINAAVRETGFGNNLITTLKWSPTFGGNNAPPPNDICPAGHTQIDFVRMSTP